MEKWGVFFISMQSYPPFLCKLWAIQSPQKLCSLELNGESCKITSSSAEGKAVTV